jgi:hypothetical protein
MDRSISKRNHDFRSAPHHRAKKSYMTFILSGLIASILLMIFGFWNAAQAADVERISKEKLKQMIGQPSLIIIDARIEKHWKRSPYKIKGAVRGNPKAFQSWSELHPKTSVLVLYCA